MISAARQFDNQRGDDWAAASRMIGGPEHAYTADQLRHAAHHDIEPCRHCGTLEQAALMTPQLTCGRCC